MRIIGGNRRGLALASVGKGDPAAHLRPTPDRVRESLFNILAASLGDPVPGARVLDLFAGTGALGLEALSRGASHVTFVDDGQKARALLRENIGRMQAQGNSKVWRRDARRLGDCRDAPFDLVFLDPPYGKAMGQAALSAARDGGWLTQSALAIWEENAVQEPPEGFVTRDTRTFGDTSITILERI